VVNVNGADYSVVVRPEGTMAIAPAASGAAPASSAPVAVGGGVVIGSPVSGTIVRYMAKEGEKVALGQTILIIESMKMELELKSTTAGNVHFLVPTGTQVSAQQPVAEILGAPAPVSAAPVAQAAPAAAPVPAAAPSGSGSVVVAPVTGTIVRYSAGEGTKVSVGQTILIIESMKMELEIKATSAGSIHFLVPTGTQVAAQQPVAELR
jgi:oxaloacetate decarboxylase alpha subunit